MHPLNALGPIKVTDFGIDIFERDLQFTNAPSLIEVTEEGMVTSVRAVHPLKENLLIDLINGENSTFLSDVQLSNANSPIEVTDDGIEILESLSHPAKVLHPIDVTEDGI